MKKKQQLTKKVQRQIALLSKYYDIDLEKGLINIELHYEKASELFELDLVTKGTPKFKTEILARVSELMESVPMDFKVDFSIKIDDYEGMEVDNVLESFKDQLEILNFEIYGVKSWRWLKATILTLICVAILFVRRFLLDQGYLNDEMLLTEMLDITAWVFLWTGVTEIFLESDEYRSVSFRIIEAMNSFALIDKNDKIVKSINREEIVKNWVKVTKKEKNARRMLLIAGALSFSIGIITIINLVPDFFKAQQDWTSFLITSLGNIAIGLIGIFGGIGACSLYRESGKFQKAVPIVSYIYVILDLAVAGYVIYNLAVTPRSSKEVATIIVNLVFTLGASILYFISYMLLRKVGKENGDEAVYKL